MRLTRTLIGFALCLAVLSGGSTAYVLVNRYGGAEPPRTRVETMLAQIRQSGSPLHLCEAAAVSRPVLDQFSEVEATAFADCLTRLEPVSRGWWTAAGADHAMRTYRGRSAGLICEVTLIAFAEGAYSEPSQELCYYALFREDAYPGPGTTERMWRALALAQGPRTSPYAQP